MFKNNDLKLLRDVTNTNRNSGNMKWRCNAKQIVQDDEASYFRSRRLSQMSQKQIINVDEKVNNVNQSMGEYFGSRSPAVSDIFDSNDFEKKNKAATSYDADDNTVIKEMHTTPVGNNNSCLLKPLKDKKGNILYATPTSNMNSTKVEIDNFFNELLKKHSDKTDGKIVVEKEHKSKANEEKAYNVTNIHISKLTHIQRFYQFKVKASCKDKVASIIGKYIDDCLINNGQKGKLMAITKNDETNDCTVLIMFDAPLYRYKNDSDYWINNFLSYPNVQNMLDLSVKPSFTCLSK